MKGTGEEGVHQMRSLCGLCDLVTNANIPNRGQISNLPISAVVETNATFRANEVTPVMAGEILASIALCGNDGKSNGTTVTCPITQ